MAVVTTVYDSTCKVCDVVRYQLFKIYIHILKSRQMSANWQIFQEIKGRDQDAGYYLTRMNEATIKKYDSKLKNFRSNLSAWGWEDPIDD